MNKYTLDTCNIDKQFIFEFKFEHLSDKKNKTNNCDYVHFTFFRNDHPKNIWQGHLKFDEFTFFNLDFNDNINIKGGMKLFKDQGKDLIWMDVFYCYNLERHFEGIIIEIPNKNEPLPPSPSPPSL